MAHNVYSEKAYKSLENLAKLNFRSGGEENLVKTG